MRLNQIVSPVIFTLLAAACQGGGAAEDDPSPEGDGSPPTEQTPGDGGEFSPGSYGTPEAAAEAVMGLVQARQPACQCLMGAIEAPRFQLAGEVEGIERFLQDFPEANDQFAAGELAAAKDNLVNEGWLIPESADDFAQDAEFMLCQLWPDGSDASGEWLLPLDDQLPQCAPEHVLEYLNRQVPVEQKFNACLEDIDAATCSIDGAEAKAACAQVYAAEWVFEAKRLQQACGHTASFTIGYKVGTGIVDRREACLCALDDMSLVPDYLGAYLDAYDTFIANHPSLVTDAIQTERDALADYIAGGVYADGDLTGMLADACWPESESDDFIDVLAKSIDEEQQACQAVPGAYVGFVQAWAIAETRFTACLNAIDIDAQACALNAGQRLAVRDCVTTYFEAAFASEVDAEYRLCE